MVLPVDSAIASLDEEALARAFASVRWPAGIMPLAGELTTEQRELVARLAELPGIERAVMPIPGVRLREWLGLAPPGRLERPAPGGSEPLWRALRSAEERGDAAPLLSSLSLAERLEAFGEVNQYGRVRPYGLEAETLFDHRDLELLDRLEDEGREWAPAFAERYLLVPPEERGDEVRWPLFVALVRAGVTIAPEWDVLLPLGFGRYVGIGQELIEAIPPERRAPAIVAAIGSKYVAEKGLPLLALFPSRELAERIVEVIETDRMGRTPILHELDRLGAHHGVVKEVVDAYRATLPPPVVLRCTRVIEPRALEDLAELAQRQLEVAGERYDGLELSAAERMSREGEETSFHGLLDVCEIVDAEGEPAYDALLYLGDSGTIFRAGTLEVVAEIVQASLQSPDHALRDGLEAALSRRPPRTPNVREPRREP